MKTTSLMAAVLTFFTAAQLTAMSNLPAPSTDSYESEIAVSGISPFCKAIVQGDMAAVEKMIQLGEDVNAKSLGKTPVIFAARYNRAEILELLLENGADPDIRCDRGYTPLKHAKLSNATAAIEILKEARKV